MRFSGLAILLLAVTMMTLAGAENAEPPNLVPLNIEYPDHTCPGLPLDWFSPYPLDTDDLGRCPVRKPVLVPVGARLLSRGKCVTASSTPSKGKLSQITDGDKACEEPSVVSLPKGLQWVQVDLGDSATLDALLLWHWHTGHRVYMQTVVQASDDAVFSKDVFTLFNNDHENDSGLGKGKNNNYVDGRWGHLIDPKQVKARYVRCYSNGSYFDDTNEYIEVEVWGR